MKTPGFHEREPNVTSPKRCRWCCNNGWVVVQYRTDQHVHQYRDKGVPKLQTSTAKIEEMGPCPMCQRGWFEEFGDAEHQNRVPGIKPPWGPEGFWVSRPFVELVALESTDVLPLPRSENARRMRALSGALVGGMAA